MNWTQSVLVFHGLIHSTYLRTPNPVLISLLTHLPWNASPQLPLQSFINHELDGRVQHQQQGWERAVPQCPNTLTVNDLHECICKTKKSKSVSELKKFKDTGCYLKVWSNDYQKCQHSWLAECLHCETLNPGASAWCWQPTKGWSPVH